MITTVVSAIFVLGLLVFVHELGHFLAAKRMDIKVERFSLGFPPKMIGKQIGDTEYCISWVPLGGYVKMAGEQPDSDDVKGEPWEFQSKSIGARAFVIAAGPGMNFLLAFVIFCIFYLTLGVALTDTTTIGRIEPDSAYATSGLSVGDRITAVNGVTTTTWEDVLRRLLDESATQAAIGYERSGQQGEASVRFESGAEPLSRLKGLDYFRAATISTVLPNSPADKAGIRPGDVITSVDGQPITQWYEMVEIIRSRPEIEITVEWQRNGQLHQTRMIPEKTQDLNPQTGDVEDIGRIGVTQQDYLRMRPAGFLESINLGAQQVVNASLTILVFVKKLVSGEVSTNNVGGPLAIAQMAGESAQRGVESLFGFIAFLSINLAILNLLPIPALDGGQLLVLGVEALIRRPLSLRQKLIWQQAGMAILAVIMVFVIYNDVARIFR